MTLSRFLGFCYLVILTFIVSIIIPGRMLFAQDRLEKNPPEFPGLEPFKASRMWAVLENTYSEIDNLDSIIVILKAFAKNQNKSVEMTEEMGYDVWPDEEDPAVFSGGIQKRGSYFAIPWLMAILESLWGREEWGEDNIELANQVAQALTFNENAPIVEFTGDSKHNGKELEKITEWFKSLTDDPATYGSMIFTFDDGPWRPLSVEMQEFLPAVDSQSIASNCILRLIKLGDDKGVWGLQCKLQDELLWSAILSKVPDDEFSFTGEAPTNLGDYGWKIHMHFGEYVHLYLDPEYRLLFYFTSW
ncbi:MAG: hypothetical protein GWN00_06645 [Aliifodinibius sp.]|nr:hypothetical protein [Fodinibius sp.]NIY24495.1 hypothetical protein [Fodinibius sp.]